MEKIDNEYLAEFTLFIKLDPAFNQLNLFPIEARAEWFEVVIDRIIQEVRILEW